MKLVAVVLAVLVFGTSIAGAPVMQRKTNPEADRIGLKVRRIQILDQLLPVLMTKTQIKALLPVIEKSRQKELDLEKKELEEMKQFEPDIDKELNRAIKEQKVATDEFTKRYLKLVNAFNLGRQILVGGSSAEVLAKMKEVLNEGQLKTAELSLDPRLFGEKDPASMTSDAKLKMWIQEVMLDRTSYDLLVDMSL
ncbi:MAG: hypothetical protein ACKVQS_13510 [Fimbriimonadaceae bacterium]